MDKVFFSLGVAALGMLTVFAGLVILIVFITILTKFTAKGESKKKNNAQSVEVKKDSEEIPGEVLAAISAALAANNEAVTGEVVAAIAAALNMVMGEGRFVVKHVKRIHNAPAWNRAGREEQIYSRF